MHLLLPFKLFLSFWNQAKEKEERNQCYSQQEEVLYYITPKYKYKVLPSTLVPTDNSKLQPWDGLQMRGGKEARAN